MYVVPTVGNGFIALMPKPSAGEKLESEIVALREKGVRVLVSLLGQDEVAKLELQDEPILAHRHGIKFISHPIPDRGVPENTDSFLSLIVALREEIEGGIGVVVH